MKDEIFFFFKAEKAGLKLSIQKTKVMASGLITSWQIGKQFIQ